MTGQALKRLIPIILIKDGYAQVTEKFGACTYIGDPVNVAKIFSDKMVDEIVIIDLDAKSDGRPINLKLLERISEHAFVPTAYAGGVSTNAEAISILRMGYEKVCLNSAFLDRPQVIREIGDNVGQSSVMVEITISNINGKMSAVDYRSGSLLSESIAELINKALFFGAGEVMIKNISADGQLVIDHIDQILNIPSGCNVPIVYSGGVGSEEMVNLLWSQGFDGVAAGTWFSVQGRLRAPMIHYPSPEKLDAYRLP
jgi:cyclase